MKEYDLFVPLYHNDGRPVEAESLKAEFQQEEILIIERDVETL